MLEYFSISKLKVQQICMHYYNFNQFVDNSCMKTDLNLEMSVLKGQNAHYLSEKKVGKFSAVTSNITTREEAESLGLRIGYYATIVDKAQLNSNTDLEEFKKVVSKYLSEILINEKINSGKILVVGIGNFNMTADALGKATLNRVIVGKTSRFELCTLTPSVVSVTGIESFDIIKSVCDSVKPDLVIVVDSLATKDADRLMTCVQISTAGMSPGSGVGMEKKLLTKETLGVPVIAMGIPFVTGAKTLANQMVKLAGDELEMSEDLIMNLENKIKTINSPLIVAPKDVDTGIALGGEIIAHAINLSVFGRFTL